MSETFAGLAVSPGIGIGSVLLHEPAAPPVVPVPIPPERVEHEIERFEVARDRARVELQDLRQRTTVALGERYAGMLDAQLLILDDPALIEDTVRRVRIGRVSARWALKEVVADYLRRFAAVDDAYLRERGGDLDDVHRRLQRLLRATRDSAPSTPQGALVVVAHALGPSDALALTTDAVVGIATDVGGRTSHTAILAQSLGLPAVVGLRDLSVRVQSGDRMIIDGESGEVIWLPEDECLREAEARRAAWLSAEQDVERHRAQPATTRDGAEITVRANIEFTHEVDTAVRHGAQGIGLYRSEFLFLSHAPRLPTEDQHYETYRELASRVAPQPTVIRTLDLGGEKYFHEVLGHEAARPVLGLRGVRLWLQRPDISGPQIRGLLRAAVDHDIQMMIPLVTTVEEIRQVRRLLRKEARELHAARVSCNSEIPVGIMIEVPAAATSADLLAVEADFFSIGTNDLVQYALAVDRGDDSMSYLAHPAHPAVLRMIRFTVESARAAGIPVALCGEMAADPALSELLIGLGLRELSVQPRVIPALRASIEQVELERAARRAQRSLAEHL